MVIWMKCLHCNVDAMFYLKINTANNQLILISKLYNLFYILHSKCAMLKDYPLLSNFELLSVSLSFCLSLWLSVFLSFCLSVLLSFCLSVSLSLCLSIFLSLCLSVFCQILFFCLALSLCLFPFYLSVFFLSVSLSFVKFCVSQTFALCGSLWTN